MGEVRDVVCMKRGKVGEKSVYMCLGRGWVARGEVC